MGKVSSFCDRLAHSSDTRLVLLITGYIVYLFAGALVFDALESPHEAAIIRDLNMFVRRFRQAHNSCLSNDELNAFIKLISQANDKGVPATANVSKEPNWSFGQAVFFSGTVLTTIGYGDVTVQTQLGKCFCILFAVIGIPVTLLLLYSIIERLMCLTQFLKELFVDKMQPVVNKMGLFNYSLHRSHMHITFAILCAIFVLVVFLIIPAHIYSYIEGWSYLNAFYYCFISLSTVGLGDYVPGDDIQQKHRHLYKICSTLYLILGVTSMVWLLQIFSETPEFNLYKYFSLSKDAILTSHRDTIHAVSGNTNGDGDDYRESLHGGGDVGGGASAKQSESKSGYSDLNRELSSGNDDELILAGSGSATGGGSGGGGTSQGQNYMSLNDIDASTR